MMTMLSTDPPEETMPLPRPRRRAQALTLSLILLAAMAACGGAAQVAPSASAVVVPAAPDPDTGEDPYLWLEPVLGDEALAWVRDQNAQTAAELEGTPAYEALERDILRILDSTDKIPYVQKRGAWYYNLWRDAEHPRGLWRRVTPVSYREVSPAWEAVLDLDALGEAEGESWVFKGAICLRPEQHRCLLRLSRGGADAIVIREFDVQARAFVEGGFLVPEAKSTVSWIDLDHVYVGTDTGPGSLTTSGYPRTARRWTRGTPLAEAPMVFEAKHEDMVAMVIHDPTPGFERDVAIRLPSFFTQESSVLTAEGQWQRVEVPIDAKVGVRREWLLIELRTAWEVAGRTYPAGALLAARFDAFMAGEGTLEALFEPSETTSLASFTWTRNHLLLTLLDDVKSRVVVLTPGPDGWTRAPLSGVPALGSLSVGAVDRDEGDEIFVKVTDFLNPARLLHGEVGGALPTLKSEPAFFDAAALTARQRFVTSKDGTRVPYFLVGPEDMALDGSHPTLLYGYGGFEVPLVPRYSGTIGRAWLSRGGVYVVANIRGGGEYGPRWHQAALKEKRPRAYEDFAAVARDLVTSGVTSPERLGIRGGSNGGLLVGNMLTDYPELFGAAACQVPLLDMKRYSHLLAGASWMEEYGDPDKPEEWAFLRHVSAYHKVKSDVRYPPTIFMTTTRDDRVHPSHARKMAARMIDLGHPVRYFENIEGGHGAGADNRQAAHFWALTFTFLDHHLRAPAAR
jgi:prolyl oligopeptidase